MTDNAAHEVNQAPKVQPGWRFYKYMAFVVGIALASATVALIIRHTSNPEIADASWYAHLWMAHGYLYMVYLVATFNLAVKRRWGLVKMFLIMLAGTIPLMSFVAESKLAQEVTSNSAN